MVKGPSAGRATMTRLRRKRPLQSIRGRVIRIGSARRPTGNAAEGMTGSSEAIDLRVQCREEVLRLCEFGELLGRREALDRRRQHSMRIGVAIGRVTELARD